MIHEIFEFNHELLGVKIQQPPRLDESHVRFVIKALREEAQEMQDVTDQFAPEIDDPRWLIVHQIDAAIDAAYFAVGLLARAGLTVEQATACFDAVDQANKRKKKGITHRGDMGSPDAAKPEGWVGPEQTMFNILFGEPK